MRSFLYLFDNSVSDYHQHFLSRVPKREQTISHIAIEGTEFPNLGSCQLFKQISITLTIYNSTNIVVDLFAAGRGNDSIKSRASSINTNLNFPQAIFQCKNNKSFQNATPFRNYFSVNSEPDKKQFMRFVTTDQTSQGVTTELFMFLCNYICFLSSR